MSKDLFKQVKKALISLQPKGLQGHALQRVTTLTAFVSGMIDQQSCHLNALGSGLPQDINDASRETAAKRFVSSPKTDYKLHFLPYFRHLLLSLLPFLGSEGLVLIVDGSQMGTHHVALMISLFYKNRSIPIFWVVKKGQKGHFPTDMHLEVVREVAKILKPFLPSALPVTLLGDGEFDSVDLQKLCREELGWDYVFRTATDTVLYENGDVFTPKTIKQHQMVEENPFIFIPSVDFSHKRYADVHFLYWHDKKIYESPLFLISSLDDPFDIIFFYKKRFAIETLFKDLKSRGFNLHKNRLTQEKEVFNLIGIAALGFCLIIAFGQDNQDNPVKIKVLRLHKIKKRELSIFAYGFKLLKYLVKYKKKFTFKFALF